jgi:hypothetical protein
MHADAEKAAVFAENLERRGYERPIDGVDNRRVQGFRRRLSDPPTQPAPRLRAMFAQPRRRDV